MNDQRIKEELLKSDHEYRKLWEQHQSFEKRLEQLTTKPHPSDEEMMEVPTLKKKKLALKDQMHAIILEHRKKSTHQESR